MKNLIALLFFISSAGCTAQNKDKVLTAESFRNEMKAPDAVILDVRTPGELERGFIEGAQNIDFNADDFNSRIDALDHNKPYYVYCLSGGRSGEAADYMRSHGFNKVYELKGGIMAWNKAGLPLQQRGQAMPAKEQYSLEDFNKLALSNKTVMFDFYAPWCVPCKQMEPLLAEIASEFGDKVKIIKINHDDNQALLRSLGIDEIPFFKVYKDGKNTGNYVGQMDKASFEKALR